MKKILIGLGVFVLGFASYPLLFTPWLIKYAPDAFFFKYMELLVKYLEFLGCY
jgi:hypothetical protein